MRQDMILISGRFVLNDEGDDRRSRHDGGAGADERRYALRLDNGCSRSPTRECRSIRLPTARRGPKGVELLAGADARHAVHRSSARDRSLFERIESELSRLLPDRRGNREPRDRDGKSHSIRVDVPRRGALVRQRRQVLNAKSDRPAPAPRVRGRHRRPQLAAVVVGAPAARRVVRAAGSRGRQGADPDPRRHAAPTTRRRSRSRSAI